MAFLTLSQAELGNCSGGGSNALALKSLAASCVASRQLPKLPRISYSIGNAGILRAIIGGDHALLT